jgi:Ca-activated chloride channel family protein
MNHEKSYTLPLIDLESEHSSSLGSLCVSLEEKQIRLPLKEVTIQASVAERIAEITMQQTFQNLFEEALEAVYIFPLSGSAAVTRFELKVGSRTVKGIVKEREEAKRDYQRALEEGKRAGLLEQERDDIFTIQVGNLPAGEEIQVLLSYSEQLPFFNDGTTELRLPLVVGQRYIPGGRVDASDSGDGVESDTDLVPDASRITPPRLCPGFDPKTALRIQVEMLLSERKSIADLECSQHAIRTKASETTFQISLSREDDPLDRDFVLRWRLASEQVESSFLVYPVHEDVFTGMVSIVPPQRTGPARSRDVVFLLDRSGSMSGIKMVSAARACRSLLATLNPSDRFCILAFSSGVESFPSEERFLCADEAGRTRGEHYLHHIEANGGTEMFEAFGRALHLIQERKESASHLPIIVLLTDGQVGDEFRILERVQTIVDDVRIFTIGIDTAVNHAFLRRIAKLGGGTASFVEPGVHIEEALEQVARDIGTPVILNLRIETDHSGLLPESLTPQRIPDLFAGRPVTFWFRTQKTASVRIRGSFMDGTPFDQRLEPRMVNLAALPHLWARSRVMDLEDRLRVEPAHRGELRKQIIDLAIEHSLLTRFTAIVAIDETEIVNPQGERRKIVQPVPMPYQWQTETVAPATFAQLAGAPAPMQCISSESYGNRRALRSAPIIRESVEWFDSAAEKVGSILEDRRRKKETRKQLREVKRLLEEFSDVLLGKNLPEAKLLEESRTRLLQALIAANLEFQYDQLVNFLMKQTVELVKALRDPKASVGTLHALFDIHRKTFQQIHRDFTAEKRRER